MLIDAKIETLEDPDSADRLFKIRVLATLLGYIQNYCIEREIKHLSVISAADHPTWLTNFFTLAGFRRCKCLKPDESDQGHRVCLKLENIKQEVPKALEVTPKLSINGEKEIKIKEAEQKTRASLGTITTDSVPSKPVNDDQASEWLSQNHQILEPGTTVPTKIPPKPNDIKSTVNSTKESSKVEDSVPIKVEVHTGPKRKRSPTTSGDQELESDERTNRRRLGHDENGRRPQASRLQDQRPLEDHINKDPKTVRHTSPPDIRKTVMCKFYQRGYCTNGSSCKFSHDPSSHDPSYRSYQDDHRGCTARITDVKIKKEPSGRTLFSDVDVANLEAFNPSRPERYPEGKSLECYYWFTQGRCNKSEHECQHAHSFTGIVAPPPPAYVNKGLAKSGRRAYGSAQDYGYENGMSIKGDGALPAGPKTHLERDGYDSYRPGQST